MRCDQCGAVAVVHVTEAGERGALADGHYCRRCATSLGLATAGWSYRDFRRRQRIGIVVVWMVESLLIAWRMRDDTPNVSLLRLAWLAPLYAAALFVAGFSIFRALRTSRVRRVAASNRVLIGACTVAAIALAAGAWLDVPHPPPPAPAVQRAVVYVMLFALFSPLLILLVRVLAWGDARVRREWFRRLAGN